MSNQYESNDPRFTKEGNAAVGQFYSSGGLNDTTGREPFEDSSRNFIGGQTTQGQQSGLGSLTSGGHAHGIDSNSHSHSHSDNNLGQQSGLGGLASGGHNHGVDHDRSSHSHSDNNQKPSIVEKIADKIGGSSNTNTAGHNNNDSHRGDGYNTSSGYSEGREHALSHTGGGLVGQNEQGAFGHGPGSDRRDNESHHGHSHHQHGGDLTGREIETEQTKGRGLAGSDGLYTVGKPSHGITGQTSGDQYGSNTAASDYNSSTSNVGTGLGRGGLAGAGVAGAGLATGEHHHDHSNTNTTGGGIKEKLGLDKDRVDRTHANEGPGAAGVGASGLGHNSNLPAGAATGGLAASTGDRPYGHDEASHITKDGAYGHGDFDKKTTNQDTTRHGDDFTGGFAATGGAYHNPHAKTALTGRETTATGVHDQHGDDTQNLGIFDKIKNAIGGHKNDKNAATDGADTVRSDVNRS